MTDLPFLPGEPDATAIERKPRKCRRHEWHRCTSSCLVYRVPCDIGTGNCERCGTSKDAVVARRNRNNGKRGRSDELTVAKILGGRKVGPLGLPWDVEVPGYLRAQAKQLDRWPSLAKVIEWLDAIPVGAEMRAVTLADTPGPGNRTRRLIVLDLSEFAERHGGVK